MTDPYANRESYRSRVSGGDLSYFRVTVKETDLLIGACSPLEEIALEAVREIRAAIEREIAIRPEFLSSFAPLPPLGKEPEPILRMLEAGRTAGTGPMAAVAGKVAASVGAALHPYSKEVIVENGGDLFLVGEKPRTVAIAAGDSPLSMKLGLKVDPSGGIGVCASSGTYGHSLSFGKADAAVIVAADCALADAAATMLGNKCVTHSDLAPAVEWAAALPGIAGALAVMGDRMAAAGDLELVRLAS